MFWVMMYLLLFGGSGDPIELRIPEAKAFRKAVDDPVRLELVLDLREQAEVFARERAGAQERAIQELSALNIRHEAEPEAIEAVLTRLDEARRGAREGLLDTRFALRDQLTRKEWEKIYGKSK